MKKALLLFLVIAVVAISGCTMPGGGGGTGRGVDFKTFSITPAQQEPGTESILEVSVLNSGKLKATDVNLQLQGLSDEWQISGGRNIYIGDLLGADPDRNIPGQEEVREWLLLGPPKSNLFSYPFTVRLIYRYSTELEGLLKSVTLDYYRQSKVSGGVEETKYTAGPLQISVQSPTSIISGGMVPVYIKIDNVGGGRTYLPYSSAPDVMSLDKVAIVSYSGIDCGGKNEIRLTDKTYTLHCNVFPGAVNDYKLVPYGLRLEYKYFIDKEGTITVLPKVITGGVI
jgi:hypothetical protein